MKFSKLGLFCLAFFLPVFVASAQTVPPSLSAALQKSLDSMRQVLNVNGLGAALQLPNDSVWSGGSGFSTLNPLDSVGPNHAFGIGSVTKTITAACVLQLADSGALALDDSLHRWLDTFPFINPNITIRQLLRHQSGIYDVITDPQYQPVMWAHFDSIWRLEDVITRFIKAPNFQAGTSWAYSNTNYLLLGMIIEKVTGKSYVEVLRERFFTPLNLHSLAIPPFDPVPPAVAHPWLDLTGDGIKDDAFNVLLFWDAFNTSAGPAGAYFATASDMARWMRTYMRGDLLSADMMTQMKTTVTTSFPAGTRYGLGVMERTYFGQKSFGHGGDSGYSANVVYFPQKDISIAILNNDGGKNSWALGPVVIALLRAYLKHEQTSGAGDLDETAPGLLAFPNPFTDVLQVSAPSESQDLRLELYNALGACVAAGTGQSGTYSVRLEQLSGLAPGVYFLTTFSNGKYQGTARVVKTAD